MATKVKVERNEESICMYCGEKGTEYSLYLEADIKLCYDCYTKVFDLLVLRE